MSGYILTDLYVFTRLAGCKSKQRIDCTASTKSYAPFEAMRNKAGELFVYLGDNTHTKAGKNRKADMALTKGEHISSVYVPDVEMPLWYGDFKGTADALLFVAHDAMMVNGGLQDGAVVEVFVARGKRNNRVSLYNLLSDGELDADMDRLREQSVADKATDEGTDKATTEGESQTSEISH